MGLNEGTTLKLSGKKKMRTGFRMMIFSEEQLRESHDEVQILPDLNFDLEGVIGVLILLL